jgi:hypothetical protein
MTACQLREIRRTDESGRAVIDFIGDPAAWMYHWRTAPPRTMKLRDMISHGQRLADRAAMRQGAVNATGFMA